MGNSRNYKIGIDVEADDSASGPLGKIAGAADSLDDAFESAGGGVGGLGASLGSLLSPTGLAVGALGAVGGAMIAAGAKAIDLAGQVEKSTLKMTSQLGLTKEEAGGFEDVMRDIYAANFGESFEDIGQSLVDVEEQFGRLGGTQTQDQLEEVTTRALEMRDAFGFEVSESVGAVTTLMENFGLTSSQAFDFIVAGQQRGLNASGDFLDTIGEYSVQFAQGGASAEQFFSIIETGQAGGVLGTDKMADAFKEFGIRIVDDSETTKTALAAIGVSYDELKQGFADGSITSIEAMQTVIDKINEIEDPIERNKAGVALFGTQWEDLSEQVITQVDTQKTKLSELEGSAASLDEQYNTAGASWESATRQWENALVDVGKEMRGLGAETLPYLAQAVEDFLVPSIAVLADWIRNVKDGQNAWDAFISGLWSLAPEGGLMGNRGRGRSSSASDLPDPNISPQSGSRPVTGEATASSSSVTNETNVSVYVERGDPEVVANATELGINRAQQMRGE